MTRAAEDGGAARGGVHGPDFVVHPMARSPGNRLSRPRVS